MIDRASSVQQDAYVSESPIAGELWNGVLLVLAGALFATLSWRTWPDILVDFGQEVYTPWRLAAGAVLYRDVAWVTGPFSQYLNALLFRVFGVSLTTLIVANLVLIGTISAIMYTILRRIGTAWSATCACLFFLAVFAFGQYSLIGNYNYVTPYRHDITHGLVLGLVNLLCLIEFSRHAHWKWLVTAGLMLGLLSLSKVEMTLAACLTTGVALPLVAWQSTKPSGATRGSTSPSRRLTQTVQRMCLWMSVMAIAALIPVVLAGAMLASALGWKAAFGHIFLQFRLLLAPELSATSAFYRAISGSDQPAANLIAMAYSTVLVVAAVVGAYLIEMGLGGVRHLKLWCGAVWVAVTVASLMFIPAGEWHAVPACLPVVLAPIILLALGPALRGSAPSTILILTAVYSLGLLPKILLRVAWSHYGFVLAMPGTLVVIHLLLHTLPEYCRNRYRSGTCFQAVMAGLLSACALSLVWSWIRIDVTKNVPVGNGGDRFYAEARSDGRTLPTVTTLAYLQQHMQADETLIVFPNGVILNYLLRKRNPTPYIMFNPWESDVHGGEQRIADTVIAAAPDYAVVVTMDLTIHGRGNFGSPEFGGRIQKFLNEQYDIVNHEGTLGGIEGQFSATVYHRRRTTGRTAAP